MSVTIDWVGKEILVPQAYLTPQGGALYKLDMDAFRLKLRDLEDSEEGIPFQITHNHNTEVTFSGVTLARVIEIINGYTITFADGQYRVVLDGANSNILDVTNINQVSIVAKNTAGLIVVTQGSGITEQDKLDIADRVWDELINGHTTIGSYGLEIIEKIKQNKESNKKYEYTEATSQNLTRNVAIGELDYLDILIKKDDDADWTSPVSTDRLYMWYEALYDSEPIYVGESD